ncbi:Intracellular proteinase inhibitor [Selenomonas sp. GACV-9]|uniref:BsuPI-related putative proteinase inhibitor n=1 Tax=Selenomonas sp. GACV-9 TaxID=3158782 RepID=UPI0008E1A661|nr:Intracellular proteinase inhibitor [Selenomonas ruminantium]
MKKILLLLSLFLLFPSMASAHFGTGIGITFPASSASSSAPQSTYASVTFENIAEELILQEKHGRLQIEFKITNTSSISHSLQHRTGQLYDIIITDKNGQKLWQWSDNMVFTQALTTVVISPHSTTVYDEELDSKTYRSIKEKAVLATAYLLDTPCKLSAKLPTRTATHSIPVLIHGGIVIGN